MTPIADMVRQMLEKGVAHEAIIMAVEGAEQALLSTMERDKRDMSRDESVTARREADRLRQQRWRERNVMSRQNRDMSRDITLVTNSPLSKEEKKEEIKKKERERATQIPEGWRPSPESWAEALVLLGSADRAELELKKFINHASEKGRASKRWNSAWANWAIKAVEYGGRNGNGTGNIRGYSPAEQSGATAVIAGVAAATERRARERNAAGQQRAAPHGFDPPARDDPELFGAG